jgi:hypothetical protein
MNKIKSSKGLDDYKDADTPEKVKTKVKFLQYLLLIERISFSSIG